MMAPNHIHGVEYGYSWFTSPPPVEIEWWPLIISTLFNIGYSWFTPPPPVEIEWWPLIISTVLNIGYSWFTTPPPPIRGD